MNIKYLDKISQYMVDDTVMDYEQKLVQYPFIPDSNSQWGLSTPLSYVQYASPFFIEFSNYCNSMYGLTEYEINYVWDQYKVIFNHKINSKPMNESVDNKEIYLDKIVQYIIDDTEIDYDREEIRLPFFLISFFFFPKPFVFRPFSIYVKDTYGLTEQEVKYVWNEYRNVINDKINSKPMNESIDNKKEKYLDKIVQYIIDDTEIDYNKNLCKLPYLYNPIPIIPPFIIPSPYYYSFLKYCKDIYGLTGDEIIYVWEKYKSIVDDKGSINESVDSKKIYLDKIVQYIIDDTIIDYEEREIKYPYFSNILLLTPNKQQHLPVHSFRAFSIYCENMYGLNIEEIQYVWHHYIKNSELF